MLLSHIARRTREGIVGNNNNNNINKHYNHIVLNPQLLFCQFPQPSNYTPNSSSCCGTERREIHLKKLRNVGFLPWDPGTPCYDFPTFFTLPYTHTGPLH